MTTELQMLVFSIFLGIVQLLLATTGSLFQRPLKWNLGPRDQKMPDLTGTFGRLDRASRNFMETFLFFVAAVLIVTALKTNSPKTALGAEFYFYGRVAYLFAYALGIPVVRTLLWFLAVIGIVMVACPG